MITDFYRLIDPNFSELKKVPCWNIVKRNMSVFVEVTGSSTSKKLPV